jgi:hypothetical protein
MKSFNFIVLTIITISCSPKDNIFYSASKSVKDVVGSILPVKVAPEVLIDSPSDNQIIGRFVQVKGKCNNTNEVVLSNDQLINNVTVDCLNDEFTAELEFTNTLDIITNIEALVKNDGLEDTVSVTLDIKVETPTIAAHINVVESLTNSVEVNWIASTSSALPLKGYVLEYKKSSESNWIKSQLTTSTSENIQNLDSSTSYDFRVKAFNGNYSAVSEINSSTKSDHSFFSRSQINTMNIGGATTSSVVAIQTGDIYLNGSLLASLKAGEIYKFNSLKGDILSSSSAYFVAGKLQTNNSSGANNNANVVWVQEDWAGKNFLLNQNRSKSHKLSVYAFEGGTVTIKSGPTTVSTTALSINTFSEITLPNNAAYTIESDAVVGLYVVSTNNSNNVIDPRPVLPSSTDQIGFASSKAFVSGSVTNQVINHSYSNGIDGIINLVDLSTSYTLNPQGDKNLYKSESSRLQSENPFFAVSYADSTGWGSAPFLSRAKLKTTYAVNANANWVAFSSVSPGVITITDTAGVVTNATLIKSGSGQLETYKVRLSNVSSGTIFNSTAPMAAWYEPKDNDNVSKDDETIMFGYNL